MQENLKAIIFSSIEDLNLIHSGEPLELSLSEAFIAEDSKLDSLSILTFLVALEGKLMQEEGIKVDFVTAVSDEANREHFLDFQCLLKFIEGKV